MSWNSVSGCHLQAGFDIAKAIGSDERHVPVLHDCNGETWDLPLLHHFRDETFEFGNEDRKGFAACDRFGRHQKYPRPIQFKRESKIIDFQATRRLLWVIGRPVRLRDWHVRSY
jgi:hypothetical protein